MESSERAARQAARRERRAAVSDPDVVMAAAAALLAGRPWSVSDMRGRLASLGYPSALLETTIVRLVELGYLDDERYAAAWVASRDRSRPRGSAALRRELMRKGIENSVIDAALADRDGARSSVEGSDRAEVAGPADLAAASRLLERRAAALRREPDLRKRRQKAYALLARNGFDPDVCSRAVGAFARFAGDPDQD